MGGNGQVDLLAKHTQNREGREGGGRVSWAMEEAGNSLPRNFSYRAVGPPSPPAYVADWAGTRTRVSNGISFRKNSAEKTRNGFRYSTEESAHSEGIPSSAEEPIPKFGTKLFWPHV